MSLGAEFAGAFDWRGRSARAAFALTFVLLFACMLAGPQIQPLGGLALVFFPVLGLLQLALLGQTRRRLRDVAWPGGLTWLILVPVSGLVLALLLSLRKPAEIPRREGSGLLRRVGFALACLLALLIASRALFASYLTSGSMKPALLTGDYVQAIRLFRAPAPGDVVVFAHPTLGDDYVKRIIAGPDDTVAMAEGQVILNGTALPHVADGTFVETMALQGALRTRPLCANDPVPMGAPCEKARLTETLPSGRSYAVLDIRAASSDNTETFAVPEGHVFVMGDNRDNSLDSRMDPQIGGVGFVPLSAIRGRMIRVVFSLDGDLSRLWVPVR